MSYTHELKDNRWLECVQSNSNVFADLVTYRPPQVTHWSDDVRLELSSVADFRWTAKSGHEVRSRAQ